VEIGRGFLGRDDRDVVRKDGIERLGGAHSRRPVIDVDARHLTERMDARVSPSCHGERVERAVELAQGTPKLALDGSEAGLRRPAVKAGSVVLQCEAKPHGTIIARVNGDEWRVEIDLDDEGHGYTLGERLRAHDLDDEARKRLGRRVIVTRDGPKLFLYASDEEAAREAERVVGELLDSDRLTASVRITRWDPTAEEWVDADAVGAPTAHPYEWEVHLDFPDRDEARQLEERLAAEGLPAHRLWRRVTVDARTAEEGNEIADRLRAEAPEADVRVEPNPEGLPHPAFVWLETRV
jgi:hypothetical protein